jgi:dTDP-4-dehydrorhamnose 3,5-epimerase
VNYQDIKGWKKHLRMTLNLVVITGVVRFVVYDENKKTFQEFILSRNSKEQYKRLTVPPGFWMAFQGQTEGENLLLNIADIEHEPTESINKEINEFKYEW